MPVYVLTLSDYVFAILGRHFVNAYTYIHKLVYIEYFMEAQSFADLFHCRFILYFYHIYSDNLSLLPWRSTLTIRISIWCFICHQDS